MLSGRASAQIAPPFMCVPKRREPLSAPRNAFQRAARKLGRRLMGPPDPPPQPARIDLVDVGGLSVFMCANDNGYMMEPHGRRRYGVLRHTADLEAGRKPACPPDDPADAQIGGTFRHVMSDVWASGRPCDCIDVGANYGIASMHMAAHIKARGAGGRVFAFECGKAGELAPKSVALNRLDDMITFERKAVAGASIPQLFSYGQAHLYGGSIAARSHPGADDWYVADAVTLDEYFSGRGRQLLLKIDVEGGEPLVLAGAKRLMARDPRPAAAVEYYPAHLARGGADPATLLDAYADGFSFFAFEPAPSADAVSPPASAVYEVAPDAMEALAAHLEGTARGWADVLLLPKEAAFHDGTRARLEKAANYVAAPF